MKKRLVTLSFLLLTAGTSSVAMAASASQPTPAPQHSAASMTAQQKAAMPKSADFSDDQVATFAKAHVKVQAIKADYLKKLGAVSKDPQAAQSVQQEAQQKMVEAVKDAGSDVETYNKIAYAIQYDGDLRERVKNTK